MAFGARERVGGRETQSSPRDSCLRAAGTPEALGYCRCSLREPNARVDGGWWLMVGEWMVGMVDSWGVDS